MTRCNAMLLAGPGHIECQSHTVEPFDHYSPEHGVGWSDGSPGARPHTDDPTPTYWEVWRHEEGGPVVRATFTGRHHPDPQGAAEAEAARLNGDPIHVRVDALFSEKLARAHEQRDEAQDRESIMYGHVTVLSEVLRRAVERIHEDDKGHDPVPSEQCTTIRCRDAHAALRRASEIPGTTSVLIAPLGGLMTTADPITAKMLDILRLDPGAKIQLSTWTGQWFVQSNLAIGDGVMVGGITEHHETPDRAVSAFWARLIAHGPDEYVTNGRSGDERRNWRWSGVMFREVSTDYLRRQIAART